jgi:hypothetical protein
MRSVALVVAAVAVLVTPSLRPLMAQRDAGAARSRGPGWLPGSRALPAAEFKVSPAELTTVVNKLTEIERIFAQVDELARPNGFEIEPIFNGFASHESVVEYSYYAMFYAPSKKIAGEGSACIGVDFNHIGRGLNAMNGYKDAAGEFFFEDPRGDPIPGATYVWNRLSPTARSWVDVMFTAGRVSPLASVTRERYQRTKVGFFEAFQAGLAVQTPYEK